MDNKVIFKREQKPMGVFRDKTSIRRTKFFQRQDEIRRKFHDMIRQKALEALYDFNADRITESFRSNETINNMSVKTTNTLQHYKSPAAQYLASRLMFPDYMVDIPESLPTMWLAFQCFEGRRVFLVSEGGSCCMFQKNGDFIQSFKTDLPPNGCTVLDGILVEVVHDKTEKFVQVTDCLSWNDCTYVDSSTECRRFLLESRFDELEAKLNHVTRTNEITLKLVRMFNATPENIHELYLYRSAEARPDGIGFIHKEALYVPGLSPLYLIFRDSTISPWCIPTLDTERTLFPEFQQNVLKLQLQTGLVVTEDNFIVDQFEQSQIPAMLNSLPSTIYLKMWKQNKIKKLLLISVEISDLNLAVSEEGDILKAGSCEQENDKKVDDNKEKTLFLLKDTRIIGTPSNKRKRADTLNKIIHNYAMRQELLHKKKKLLSFSDVISYSAVGLPCKTLLYLKNNVSLESFFKQNFDQH